MQRFTLDHNMQSMYVAQGNIKKNAQKCIKIVQEHFGDFVYCSYKITAHVTLLFRMTLTKVDESIMLRVTTLIDDVWQQAGNICRCYNTPTLLVVQKKSARKVDSSEVDRLQQQHQRLHRRHRRRRRQRGRRRRRDRFLLSGIKILACNNVADRRRRSVRYTSYQKCFSSESILNILCVLKKYYLIVHIEVSRNTTKSLDKSFHFFLLSKIQTNLVIRNFLVTIELFPNAKCSLSL